MSRSGGLTTDTLRARFEWPGPVEQIICFTTPRSGSPHTYVHALVQFEEHSTALECIAALDHHYFLGVDDYFYVRLQLSKRHELNTRANDARSFVLCPGGAYDRSPCGTGTSAALACRVARGEFGPGRTWRQESVIGSVFEATCEHAPEGGIVPTITGRAWIVAEGDLVIDPADPFRHGVPGSTGGNP